MTDATTTAGIMEDDEDAAARKRAARRPRVLTGALLGGLAVLVALSFGFSWGNVGNQDTYLIGALADADPTLFPRDWLVRETFHYHENFRLIVRALMLAGNVGVATAILNLLLTLAGLALSAQMLRALMAPAASGGSTPAPPGPLALATLGLFLIVMAGQTASVGVTYIFSSGFQPSVLAAVFWLAAFLLFLRERWLLSGVALALGGFWHANFLVLGIPLFGLAHLLLGPRRLVPRGAAQLLPSIAMLLPQLPALLAAGGAEGAAQAREIMQVFRSPSHYLPMTYLWGFLPWAFWHLPGLFAAFALRRNRAGRLAGALLASCFVAVASATLLTTVVYLPQVSQVFVWRIAPFGILLAQIILLAWVASPPLRGVPFEQPLKAALLAGCAGFGALLLLKEEYVWSATALIFALAGVGLLLHRQLLSRQLAHPQASQQSRRPQVVLAAFGLLAMAAAAHQGIENFRHVWRTSTLMPPWQASEQKALYDWVSTTPKDALFLTPPEMATFRILALRSIVVDWKSTPMLPGELIDWYRRIEAVSGVAAPETRQQVVAGYRAMTTERLASLHREFGFDYAVFAAPLPQGLPEEAVRYRSGSYVVLQPGAAR